LANRGMPVTVDATGRALAAVAQSGGFYHLANSATVAAWTGDVLQLRLFGSVELLSLGDVLLVVGIAVIVAQAMLGSNVDVAS
jgi:hypothetical protein